MIYVITCEPVPRQPQCNSIVLGAFLDKWEAIDLLLEAPEKFEFDFEVECFQIQSFLGQEAHRKVQFFHKEKKLMCQDRKVELPHIFPFDNRYNDGRLEVAKTGVKDKLK